MPTGLSHGEGGAVSPAALAALVESYVAQHPAAAVLEEGQLIFDMRQARYSIADSHGRCVLQVWSHERNIVRTVVSAQLRSGALRLMTRRLGAVKPVALEVVPTPDRRTPTTRHTERRQYMRLLERALLRSFPDCKPDGFRSASDLEHS